MTDKQFTPPATLIRARRIALKNGIHYAYTGNVRDSEGGSTYCSKCGRMLIGRDGFRVTTWNLDDQGHCAFCGVACAGIFEKAPILGVSTVPRPLINLN